MPSPSPFEPVVLRDTYIPSFEELLEKQLADDPLYLDRPITTSTTADELGMSDNALRCHIQRGTAPASFKVPGVRAIFFTRRANLQWLYSGNPAAKKALARVLSRFPEQEVAYV